jgi:hypothetical protein
VSSSPTKWRKKALVIVAVAAATGAYMRYEHNDPVRRAEFTSANQGTLTFANVCANANASRERGLLNLEAMGGQRKDVIRDGVKMTYVSDRGVVLASVGRSPDKIRQNKHGAVVSYQAGEGDICQVAISRPKDAVLKVLGSSIRALNPYASLNHVSTTETGIEIYHVKDSLGNPLFIVSVSTRDTGNGNALTILTSAEQEI